jgi:hypothetical protein
MSRSQYSDDFDNNWTLIIWRGAVASAIRGKRGQQLLKDIILALDAMPDKRLIAHALLQDGDVCTLGALGCARQLDMAQLDPDEPEEVAQAFGVAPALVREIAFENDEAWGANETPEQRWKRMRQWIVSQV